tara:strand:+ start:194 stop:391 length:198 start_codon:yes stop_codon:yes gene_type:complete
MKHLGIKTKKAERNKCCKKWENISFQYGDICDGGFEVYKCKNCNKLVMCDIHIERDFTNCLEIIE